MVNDQIERYKPRKRSKVEWKQHYLEMKERQDKVTAKIELLRQEKIIKEDLEMMSSELSPHGRIITPEGEKMFVDR